MIECRKRYFSFIYWAYDSREFLPSFERVVFKEASFITENVFLIGYDGDGRM